MARWQAATRVSPKLRFQKPGAKPGRSTWFYFREAEGFGRGTPAVVVYKAERGQSDLAGISAADLAARTTNLLEEGMEVVAASKSASVRIRVPSIDFNGSAENQTTAIEAGLLACEALRTLYVERLQGA